MDPKLIWDLLPEEFPYEDKGCELFPSCLNCPFPDCLKEEPWGKERFLKSRRAERMVKLKREGKSVKEIARIFEVSPRTVQRWLKVMEATQDSVVKAGKETRQKRQKLEILNSKSQILNNVKALKPKFKIKSFSI